MSTYPSYSRKGKITILQLGNMLSWCVIQFSTIFFSGQDNLKQQLRKEHHIVAMATVRSPIKVPFENEDLPDKENAPDFDEDTLRGELVQLCLQLLQEPITYVMGSWLL